MRAFTLILCTAAHSRLSALMAIDGAPSARLPESEAGVLSGSEPLRGQAGGNPPRRGGLKSRPRPCPSKLFQGSAALNILFWKESARGSAMQSLLLLIEIRFLSHTSW